MRDAVEVRADADVIDAGDLDDVVDVVGDVAIRPSGQLGAFRLVPVFHRLGTSRAVGVLGPHLLP